MKKSIPVASWVDMTDPASDVPIGNSLSRPQVVCFCRTSDTRERMEVTDAVYAAEVLRAPSASFRMNSFPTMI